MNRNNNSKKNNSKITSPMITALYCRLSLEDGKDSDKPEKFKYTYIVNVQK